MSTKTTPKGSVFPAGSELAFKGRQAFTMDHHRLTSRALAAQLGDEGMAGDPTHRRGPREPRARKIA